LAGGLMMQISDFYKGQDVVLLYSDYSKTEILDAVVKTVGRRYITVSINAWRDIQFDSQNNFKEKTEFKSSYKLFLNRNDLQYYLNRNHKLSKLYSLFRWESSGKLQSLSDDEIDLLITACEKLF
jgi:hypothetical protein